MKELSRDVYVYIRRTLPPVYLFPVPCVYTLVDEAELCFVSGSAQVPFLASILILKPQLSSIFTEEHSKRSDIDFGRIYCNQKLCLSNTLQNDVVLLIYYQFIRKNSKMELSFNILLYLPIKWCPR